MKSYSGMSLIFYLTCSLVASGCATTGASAKTAPPITTVAREGTATQPEADEPATGWPPYYAPLLLGKVSGIDQATGKASSFSRGYLFHRVDVEKLRVLKLHADRCDTDLAECERRVAEATALPSFWSRTEGRVLLIAIGFAAGVGTTVGIVYAVGGGP